MATVGGSGGYSIKHTGIKRTGKNKLVDSSLRAVDGTTVFSKENLIKNWETIDKGRKAMAALSQVISQPPKSAFKEIQLLRKYAKEVLQYQFIYQDFVEACSEEQSRLIDGMSDRARKRWAEDEDNILVDMASRDEENITSIAMMLGRTPGAIQTRLSYLVGIEKVSTKVAGRFVGWMDGEHVEVDIDGTVTR